MHCYAQIGRKLHAVLLLLLHKISNTSPCGLSKMHSTAITSTDSSLLHRQPVQNDRCWMISVTTTGVSLVDAMLPSVLTLSCWLMQAAGSCTAAACRSEQGCCTAAADTPADPVHDG